MGEEKKEKAPKYGKIVKGADDLSLGISIVVAILLGIGLGLGMKALFEIDWLLWVGVFWGIAAAVLNVYKAYQAQVKSYDEIKDDPRYKHQDLYDDDDDD